VALRLLLALVAVTFGVSNLLWLLWLAGLLPEPAFLIADLVVCSVLVAVGSRLLLGVVVEDHAAARVARRIIEALAQAREAGPGGW